MNMIPAFLSKFKAVTDEIQTLRESYATLEAERCAIGEEIRRVNTLPPTRDEVKQILVDTVNMFHDQWEKKLRGNLEFIINNPHPYDQFTERFKPSAGNLDFWFGNGFPSLWSGGMLSAGIDHFVENMEWPDDRAISNQERARRIEELEKKLAPLQEKANAIHETLTQAGVSIREIAPGA